MSRIEVIPGLHPDTYLRHSLHSPEAVWTEKNCYGDLWIELLHALKQEPLAMLPFTLAVDFEGDQWTFFKPSLEELRALYGIDVQELTVWRPLIDHAIEHLGAGKLISTEADAFWLPDTAGTDYRTKHSKTTILLNSLDVDARHLGYFHNAGYFELHGEDFSQLFRLDVGPTPELLPLFAELVRVDRLTHFAPAESAAHSWELLKRHLGRRPTTNPIQRFGERFQHELPQLLSSGMAHYHAWAFATIRQAGAAFDLLAAYCRWQAEFGHSELAAPSLCFDAIAQGHKALILKAARAVNSGRLLDASPQFTEMSQSWEQGMTMLQQAVHGPK
ncbi:MAG: DUF1839 family protein [Burkholderiales bacterium]|nr:DUF1839 family protein [Burkholderiales bacterium]